MSGDVLLTWTHLPGSVFQCILMLYLGFGLSTRFLRLVEDNYLHSFRHGSAQTPVADGGFGKPWIAASHSQANPKRDHLKRYSTWSKHQWEHRVLLMQVAPREAPAKPLVMWLSSQLKLPTPFGNTQTVSLMQKNVHNAWQAPPAGQLEALPSHKVWLPWPHVLGNLSILLRASFARLRATIWEVTLRANSFHGWRACSKNGLKMAICGPVKSWVWRKMPTGRRSREPMQLFIQTRAVACRMRSFTRRRSPLSSSKHGGTSETLGMTRMTEFERHVLMHP